MSRPKKNEDPGPPLDLPGGGLNPAPSFNTTDVQRVPPWMTNLQLAQAIVNYIETHDAYLAGAYPKREDAGNVHAEAIESRFPAAHKELWRLGNLLKEANTPWRAPKTS